MRAVVKSALTVAILFVLFAFNQAGATPVASAFSIPVQSAVTDTTYLVQQGDTYYSLSRRFSIPLDSLQKWNGTQLQMGQTLYLTRRGAKGNAVASKPASATGQQTSIVKAPVKAATQPVSTTAQTPAKPAKQTTSAKQPATAKAEPQVSRPAASPPAQSARANTTGPARTQVSTSAAASMLPTLESKVKQRILVVPFDPYLYFSDADDEIARHSKIPRQNVRHVFRGRLNALLAPEGYETINLLGGVYRDSVSELSTLYKSLSYGYQDNKQSRYNHQPTIKAKERENALDWVKRKKNDLNIRGGQPATVPVAQDENKHFGVKVKDPKFFSHFNGQYGIDYYVFINQFEVKTNYENCLDRATWNYERDFLVHYSIYNSQGELVSGNKVKVPYQSNMNDVQRIVTDNMPNMAKRVLADLPQAQK
ncbi:LysM peptidoglycan-binding domain-containing protein [Pontibacter sp. HSC-36F09]|uniref:LysM peptidoglycan-binding domain-containing protein n=1 Tax=Pontibacter sp. HSC-36F09 TaxID=2910966 RepID=UPI0020A1AADD|nr:LysM peptidoglycan-binding domain-containing protein [Pontibacter sp. HSC-36F09]MCP2042240.1 murein DD-endopeptidase MepM/ murein hydrolase activator NlpD [Pontibacter sp. HSC-36F09]